MSFLLVKLSVSALFCCFFDIVFLLLPAGLVLDQESLDLEMSATAALEVHWKQMRPKCHPLVHVSEQARSQKFAMGGLFWGSRGGAPSARKFCIFLQNNIFRAILIKKNAFKTWLRNWQCKHD